MILMMTTVMILDCSSLSNVLCYKISRRLLNFIMISGWGQLGASYFEETNGALLRSKSTTQDSSTITTAFLPLN